MTAVFEKILEMSLTSAIVIAVVALIRLFLRKTPRKYAYALWSVAANPDYAIWRAEDL